MEFGQLSADNNWSFNQAIQLLEGLPELVRRLQEGHQAPSAGLDELPEPQVGILGAGRDTTALAPRLLGAPAKDELDLGGTVLLCVLAATGLAYSLYPYIVLDRLTIWEAAAAPSSLMFVFVGVAIVLPFTIGYTIFVYRIFHGKATGLSYGERD